MQELQAFIEDLTERFRRDLQAGLAELEADGEPATMEQIEELVERIKTRLGRVMEQGILEPQPDEHANQVGCPECGGKARFHSVSRRQLLSWHGEPGLSRRWYRCSCGCGFAPLDRRLGLDAGATTPRLRQQLAAWAANRTFQQVATDLRSSRSLEIGESTVERVAVACGARLREQSARAGAAYEAGHLPEPVHQPRTLYLSMDGVYAPLRDAWKKDGSAGELTCRGGECKVGMAYEVLPDRQGQPRVAWREYTATFQDIAAFRPQLAALAHRCGAETAERLVFLADTLACNWTLATDYFPHAVQIVDWRHAVGHLETVQTACFSDPEAGARWLAARKAELWEGQATTVAAAILALPVRVPETAEQAETRRREAEYFRTHQARMRYPTFRAAG